MPFDPNKPWKYKDEATPPSAPSMPPNISSNAPVTNPFVPEPASDAWTPPDPKDLKWARIRAEKADAAFNKSVEIQNFSDEPRKLQQEAAQAWADYFALRSPPSNPGNRTGYPGPMTFKIGKGNTIEMINPKTGRIEDIQVGDSEVHGGERNLDKTYKLQMAGWTYPNKGDASRAIRPPRQVSSSIGPVHSGMPTSFGVPPPASGENPFVQSNPPDDSFSLRNLRDRAAQWYEGDAPKFYNRLPPAPVQYPTWRDVRDEAAEWFTGERRHKKGSVSVKENEKRLTKSLDIPVNINSDKDHEDLEKGQLYRDSDGELARKK